jgi:hypothetical protein
MRDSRDARRLYKSDLAQVSISRRRWLVVAVTSVLRMQRLEERHGQRRSRHSRPRMIDTAIGYWVISILRGKAT